jgi:hypothetical protein
LTVTAYQVQVGVLEWNRPGNGCQRRRRLLRLIVDAVSCLSVDIDEVVLWIAWISLRVHRWQPQTSTVETGPESPLSYYTIVISKLEGLSRWVL